MSENKNKMRLIVFSVLALTVTVFIFSNSLQPPDESNSRSQAIAEWIYGFPFFGRLMSEEAFHRLIRKLAHFTEFGALGISLGGAAYALGRLKSRKYITLPMLIALFTAVCDEFIQSFTGRTSCVKDVLIDFSGALFGLAITWAVSSVSRRKHIKRQGLN